MKLQKLLIGSVAAFMIILTGCNDAQPKPNTPASSECIVEGIEAPNWVCGIDNQAKDYFLDVGIAQMSNGGFGFTRREALANARSNLAQQIQTLVKDKVENFTRSTGIGTTESIDKVSTQVSKQVAKVTMNGSVQKAFWQTPNNIYVLVSMPKENVMKAAQKQVVSSFKNDNALWQQFQAKQGLDSLEKEFK